jgi:hypothetical protein
MLSINVYADAMQGAYIEKDGWVPSNISQFNTDVGKSLAIVNLYSSFDYGWPNQLRYQTANIVARQATPMITWMPITSARKTINILPEIVAGQWDVYIDNWIAGLKTWQAGYGANKPALLIRFAHEFNGNWYPWGNDPNNLRAAWRYVRTKFNAAGVTGVEWVWCANNVDVDSYKNIALYYPGDDVVEWTGLDGFNWGSNYSFSRWKSFAETFSVPYTKLVTTFPTKPVMIAEVGSTEPSDLPNLTYGQNGNNADANESKELWVGDMYSRIMSEYPAIRAVAWFNFNKELSWALNGTARNSLANTGLTAYRLSMSNAFYRGTFSPLAAGVWAMDTLTLDSNGVVASTHSNDGSQQQNHHALFADSVITWSELNQALIEASTFNQGVNEPLTLSYANFNVTPESINGLSLGLSIALTIKSTPSTDGFIPVANSTKTSVLGQLPSVAYYHILPLAVGRQVLDDEADGFRHLSKKALDAILNAKLELIEP